MIIGNSPSATELLVHVACIIEVLGVEEDVEKTYFFAANGDENISCVYK